MDELVTRRVIQPSDCVIGFGIPTDHEGFLRAQASPSNRDFVVNCCPDIRDYRREVITYTDRLLPVMTDLGASVVRDLTLHDFKALFYNNPVAHGPGSGGPAPARSGGCGYSPIIILFAHWNVDSVEFADGLASIEDVIEAVPHSYNGIIDLCVCHPKELALELRRLRQDCVVRFVEGSATPAFWLYFYLVVFKKLLDSRITYLDAVSSTIDNFLNHFQEESCGDYKRFLRRVFSKLGL